MENHPMNNENNDSVEASPDVDLDEMSSSNFGILPCCNNYFGPKNDKESQKMFGNVKRIFQLWKTVKNKKINVSQDSPKVKHNKPDKSADIDVFLKSNILEDSSNLQQPLAASSSFHQNQSDEKSLDHNCLDNPHCSKLDCVIPEKKFQSCVGTIHTQIDYVHWLVPDLLQITNCNYYWGVMDRFEAEKVLENRAEGTFLLRDSAQEEFLFSVSFRRYSRSLHARIEQLDHNFSFDSHDSSVFASRSVCGLIEHYKDPSCCMFFEPMLTIPLPRFKAFNLQQLCRATICTMITYDGISCLPIPKTLKQYLQYYHYKQKVRVRQF